MYLQLNMSTLRHPIEGEIKVYYTSKYHTLLINEAIQFIGTNCNKCTKKFAIRNNTSLTTYAFLMFL
jgi:hypothetical protein